MKNQKKRGKGQYWQNCPVCGDTKRFLYKSTTLHWKPYSVSCAYCRFCSEPAFTKRGARKKWNKATNVHLVEMDDYQVQNFLRSMKTIINQSGYNLLTRIEIRDRRTGRNYR